MNRLKINKMKNNRVCIYKLKETLYLIFDYPYKYYTFKHFEV